MILQAFPAPLDLSPFVSGYLYGLSDFKNDLLIPTIPRGVPALIIVMNKANKVQLACILRNKTNPLPNGVYLCGRATQMWRLKVSTCRAYMVVLKPIALSMVLGESADAYNDLYLPLNDLLPACRFLPEQLFAEKSRMGQLAVLDSFLRNMFRGKETKHHEVGMSVQYILQTQGQVKVSELSTRERISDRTLTRRFTEQVGMPPKQYIRIIRFRALLNHLLLFLGASWLDITYKFGYYDQAHFIRDFQHFMCLSPNQYLTQDRSFDGGFIQAVSNMG